MSTKINIRSYPLECIINGMAWTRYGTYIKFIGFENKMKHGNLNG